MAQYDCTDVPGKTNLVRKLRSLGKSTANLKLASRASEVATAPSSQNRPGRLTRLKGRLKSSLSLRNLKTSSTGAPKDLDSDSDSEPSTPRSARVVFLGTGVHAGYISCPALNERTSDYATFYEEQRYEISHERMDSGRLRRPRANTACAAIARPILPRSELIEISKRHENDQLASTLKPPPWYQPPSREVEHGGLEIIDTRVSIDSTVNR
ncbi:hypothetical protein EIP86_010591 [Pleurotus ostreatoroseus]|nr:hypothetical protein EIP86_010591 [Pleurotus ostreatoroseus]